MKKSAVQPNRKWHEFVLQCIGLAGKRPPFFIVPPLPNHNICNVLSTVSLVKSSFWLLLVIQFDRTKTGLEDSKGFRNTPASQEKISSTIAKEESDGLPGSNQRDSATPVAQSSSERGTSYHFRKHKTQSDLATGTRKATMDPDDKTTDDGKKKKKLWPRSKIKVILVFNVLPFLTVSGSWYHDK